MERQLLNTMGKITTRTLELQGSSGTQFNFGIYTTDTSFNSVGGVYVFTKRTPKTNGGGFTHEVIYIGKTSDFSTRFSNHHKKDEIAECGANCLCLMSVSTETERTKIEIDLLSAFNTPCNDMLN